MRSLKQLWKQKNIELTQTLDKVFETLTWLERGKTFLVVSNPPCCKNDVTTLITANANTKSNMPWFRSLHGTSGKTFFKTSWKFWTSLRIQILNHYWNLQFREEKMRLMHHPRYCQLSLVKTESLLNSSKIF